MARIGWSNVTTMLPVSETPPLPLPESTRSTPGPAGTCGVIGTDTLDGGLSTAGSDTVGVGDRRRPGRSPGRCTPSRSSARSRSPRLPRPPLSWWLATVPSARRASTRKPETVDPLVAPGGEVDHRGGVARHDAGQRRRVRDHHVTCLGARVGHRVVCLAEPQVVDVPQRVESVTARERVATGDPGLGGEVDDPDAARACCVEVEPVARARQPSTATCRSCSPCRRGPSGPSRCGPGSCSPVPAPGSHRAADQSGVLTSRTATRLLGSRMFAAAPVPMVTLPAIRSCWRVWVLPAWYGVSSRLVEPISVLGSVGSTRTLIRTLTEVSPSMMSSLSRPSMRSLPPPPNRMLPSAQTPPLGVGRERAPAQR